MDIPPFRVLDNFILGSRAKLVPDRAKALAEFRALATKFDFSLSPEAQVSGLTVGERQQLEILRLLWLGARVLILDEPTTGISKAQKDKLFAALRILADDGMTIFFVSHKLEDVRALCSSAAVLRQGKLTGTVPAPFDDKELVRLMFGREVDSGARTASVPGRKVLSVRSGDIDGFRLRVKGIELEARAGEVIGLAGMEGSGQDLFLGACAGLVQASGGQFCLDEEEHPIGGKSYHELMKRGISYLPAARLEKALVPGLSLEDHFVLSTAHKGIFIDRSKAEALAKKRIADFNIKGRPDSLVESLSGGNQQRALLSLLPETTALILVEHPTRGLDIESTIYIWGRLKERCAKGTAIVFISSDLDEILQYSDKVLVFFSGRVSPPLNAESLDVPTLGALIGGVGWENFGAETAHG
jgi:simple sugar transport system ATP-binding protein